MSAGRVGVDEALSYVLSWYESIPLDRLKHARCNGKYEKDPELKRQRQELACYYIDYADVDVFREDIRPPPAEESGTEVDGEEGEASEEGEDSEVTKSETAS
jgi:hypothetical protein